MLIPRDFFARPSVEVAPDLLGCVLEHETADGLVAVELTEVEAYAGRSDPASHAYRGKTQRNAVMFGPPGHAYVYFTYGMHFCVNMVCLGEEGSASAVLLRAGAIIAGEDLARARRTRGPVPEGRARIAPRDLARGPARLCQALGIDRSLDGADVCVAGSPLRMLRRGGQPGPFGCASPGGRNPDPPWNPPQDCHRTPGRGEQRRRDPLAVLVRRGPDRLGVPGACAPATQTGYPLTARWWHHAGVDDIIDELSWRGLIAVSTDLDELRLALKSGRVTLYGGFDPTAPGLHIGNLVLLVTMRRLQLAGHRPIGLVGGATGLIGDPSGKSAERVLNPAELVAEWVERIRGEVSRFLDFDAGESSALIVSNLDWTAPMHVLDFLRDIGKHFSVNRMLDRESVKARLEAGGISYTEFSYQLLQAMDYLELYRRYGCTLQLGGSDQWGNLVAGVGLIRSVESASVHALATPLITKPDGTKYGKTEGGAIWLSADLMSPYAFYQFWLNVSDAEVPNLLRVFSFKSREEIDQLVRESTERPAARIGQRALAEEVTTLVHGAEETQRAIAASRALFGQGSLTDLDERTLAAVAAEVRAAEIPGDGGLPPVANLMVAAGVAPTVSAARRTIAEGGAYLNNQKVTDEKAVPGADDLLHGRYLILRRGKRTVGAVEVYSRGQVVGYRTRRPISPSA